MKPFLNFLRKVAILSSRVAFGTSIWFFGLYAWAEYQRLDRNNWSARARQIANVTRPAGYRPYTGINFVPFEEGVPKSYLDHGAPSLEELEERLGNRHYAACDYEKARLVDLRKWEQDKRDREFLENIGVGLIIPTLLGILAYGLVPFLNWFQRWNP